MIRLPFLDGAPPHAFPPVDTAQEVPDGLLAAGGDLSPERLLAAYRRGIFPWYSDGQPILWWSPSQRAVLDTASVHVPRRFARWLRGCDWRLRADSAFAEVVRACAEPRRGEAGTWITADMQEAYGRLHRLGHAHSVEVFAGERLVGGIYGVAIGHMFFGESMFSGEPNGSRVALLGLAKVLCDWGFPLLDAQLESPHLARLGARGVPRALFCAEVARLADRESPAGTWGGRFPALAARDLAP
ncbi:MAG: leucyl/phenylalanyl-tRNA--protein transferase [Xanthomonadales bacterium]|nr:leucyl/phenylalanyl-tRNA--protein transferase [Xanthomonadales bacterium]